MVPWSKKRVTDLPPNARLHEMQQNTHRLVQLIRAATPDVPNQTPSPQLSKQMLNAQCSSWGYGLVWSGWGLSCTHGDCFDFEVGGHDSTYKSQIRVTGVFIGRNNGTLTA